jgi:hypothetical protein
MPRAWLLVLLVGCGVPESARRRAVVRTSAQLGVTLACADGACTLPIPVHRVDGSIDLLPPPFLDGFERPLYFTTAVIEGPCSADASQTACGLVGNAEKAMPGASSRATLWWQWGRDTFVVYPVQLKFRVSYCDRGHCSAPERVIATVRDR